MSLPKGTRFAAASAMAFLLLGTCLAAAQSKPGNATGGKWSVGFVAGQMTTNGIDEVLLPGKVDFANQNFAGVILGYEWPLADIRWDIGVEVQGNQHFGQHDYQEFVVPFTIRYSPARPWLPAFDSLALGLGVSYASETPQVEISTRGASQRALLYLSLETAFSVGDGGSDVFFRLHHRSDAYGLFATDAGSNALAIGIRKSF